MKIALVYLHDRARFEVWLSARNREISKQYEPALTLHPLPGITTFHDPTNLDAIVESVLVSTPDFEDSAALILKLQQGVEQFIKAVND